MTDESRFRDEVHRAVNACTAAAHEDPFLLQHVLARADRKEEPRMKKKLSTAAILVIALLLLSVAALAVGLTVEEVWKQSFDRMNTVGIIYSEASSRQRSPWRRPSASPAAPSSPNTARPKASWTKWASTPATTPAAGTG